MGGDAARLRRLAPPLGVLALTLLAGCAGRPGGEPLTQPEVRAREALTAGPEGPHRVVLEWEYVDRRGSVGGDGVLRFNPPDSLRLDLFGAGDASMSVALAGAGLRSAGQIEDVRIPPAPFLYASAGLFRPGSDGPTRGYMEEGREVLVYPSPDGGTLHFSLRGERLVRLEERRGSRAVRELEVDWPESGAWPESARYRDRAEESRARWRVRDVRPEDESFPQELYELPIHR